MTWYQKVLLLVGLILLQTGYAHADDLSHAFEFRYVSTNPSANGETDFKGETAIFTTSDRIEFLRQYAEYARRFWDDPNLDTEVVTDTEVESALESIKPQPLPSIRREMRLQNWRWLGYKSGQREEEQEKLQWWETQPGVGIENGVLHFQSNSEITRTFTPQSWRFAFEFRTRVPRSGVRSSFRLTDHNQVPAITVGFDSLGNLFYKTGGSIETAGTYNPGSWYHIKIEADVPAGRYNLYVNDERIAYFVPMEAGPQNLSEVNTFSALCVSGQMLDDLWGVGYYPTDRIRRPYNIATFLDEDFQVKPIIDGWQETGYNDSLWQQADLPKAHGSERYAGEDLYLRKTVEVDEFERAFLNVETLDPGGAIWVNGQLVTRSPNRHPIRVDVTDYLKENAQNLIAVKVDHFYLTEDKGIMMGHTPLDFNFGWFAGRISLELTADRFIKDVFMFTADVSDPAEMKAQVTVTNDHWWAFEGEVEITLYPWYPEESSKPAASTAFPVKITNGPRQFEHTFQVPSPDLWTFDNPTLYKVIVTLKDDQGNPIDDKVITTGIRTVSQEGGTFRVNGEPAMLNGAQIFGARAPLSKTIEWYRCPPLEWVAKEILMIQKMNGNLMRIHVHAWQNPAAGVNDPRFAELGDQLGIMFIWSTTAWIRTGKGWGQIDFEGYPEYMKQVRNHPSIVMWEVSNHPGGFRERPVSQTGSFCEKAYETVYSSDPSRIISYTSYIHRLRYANDEGTRDHRGNVIEPVPEWTAPRVTRGNQDSYAGYGREWSVLRNAPDFEYRPYLPGFLNSPDRAYFNFEHEESIGQPNWTLVRGKPWYQLQSYEWDYDTGSIGRRLRADEWMESQGWQAFSAYEAMRKQRIMDYDGFSWCCLHGGPNTVTYKKPLIDFPGHAKLAYWANKMAFQQMLGGTDNVDVVYGPDDVISPVIINLGPARTVNLTVIVKNMDNEEVDREEFRRVEVPGGRTVKELDDITPEFRESGYYGIEYIIDE